MECSGIPVRVHGIVGIAFRFLVGYQQQRLAPPVQYHILNSVMNIHIIAFPNPLETSRRHRNTL